MTSSGIKACGPGRDRQGPCPLCPNTLDAAAMDKSRKKTGLGRLLMHAITNRAMEAEPDVLCGMAWKSVHGGTNAVKLLFELGLRESLEIAGY